MLANIHTRLLSVIMVLITSSSTQRVSAQIWTVGQCIDTALTRNKQIMISRNNAQISEEKFKEARGAARPALALYSEI